MPTEQSVLTTPDGRSLEVLTAGPPDGLPLLFHNGTPGGLVAFPPMIAIAAERGLRTVMYARPGYGQSTAQPGRSVAGTVADAAVVLDHLGAEQFVTAGWSGGGPHALACAALLPGRCQSAATIAGVAPSDADEFITAGWSGGGPHALACAALLPVRCLAAASIAGAAPYDSPGLDWLAGMADENVAEFRAALAGEADLTTFLDAAAPELRGIGAAEVAAGLGGLVSEADKAVLTGEFAEHLAASLSAALSTGLDGWRDDDLAFTRDWGLSLAALGHATPVAIWQGDQDRMVPAAHASWLAENIPRSRLQLLPGEGHLTLMVKEFGRILDDLMDLARLSRP